MTRENQKDKELLRFADLIMSAEDYDQRIQRLNGLRMGLTNRYKLTDESKFDNFKKIKRINALKNLLEAYK